MFGSGNTFPFFPQGFGFSYPATLLVCIFLAVLSGKHDFFIYFRFANSCGFHPIFTNVMLRRRAVETSKINLMIFLLRLLRGEAESADSIFIQRHLTGRNQGTYSSEEEGGPWKRGCKMIYF